jgi:hypothetical protein
MPECTLGDLAEQLRALSDDVREVMVSLTGNGFGAEAGLISRVRALEAQDKELATVIGGLNEQVAVNARLDLRRWDRARWIGVGGLLAVTGEGGWIVTLLLRDGI